jgi:hypothetical protein
VCDEVDAHRDCVCPPQHPFTPSSHLEGGALRRPSMHGDPAMTRGHVAVVPTTLYSPIQTAT